MSSSRGARNGTGAPCSIGSAKIASLLLGNRLGSSVFSAEPSVCTSRFGVCGGMSVCTILKEPKSWEVVVVVEGAEGVEGM